MTPSASPETRPLPDPPADAGGGPVREDVAAVGSLAEPARSTETPVKRTPWARVTDWLEKHLVDLTTRSNFLHRVISFIWLPIAFKSGIKFVHSDSGEIVAAVLPFKRFNRNWYKAVAGATLLANAEIAAGMYVFQKCKGFTVVCKSLEYRFLRPCQGKTIYYIEPSEDIEALRKTGTAFNLTLRMRVAQLPTRKQKKERRVGRVTITFHVKPKREVRERENRTRGV